jgi:hypothetical protein
MLFMRRGLYVEAVAEMQEAVRLESRTRRRAAPKVHSWF